MEELCKEKEYSFVSSKDKEFIAAFDTEMDRLGYTCGNTIGDGYCRERKMIIYSKWAVKAKNHMPASICVRRTRFCVCILAM